MSSEEQSQTVDQHIDKILEESDKCLLPAFHPVINPVDDDWNDLKMTFSYHFKTGRTNTTMADYGH